MFPVEILLPRAYLMHCSLRNLIFCSSLAQSDISFWFFLIRHSKIIKNGFEITSSILRHVITSWIFTRFYLIFLPVNIKKRWCLCLCTWPVHVWHCINSIFDMEEFKHRSNYFRESFCIFVCIYHILFTEKQTLIILYTLMCKKTYTYIYSVF